MRIRAAFATLALLAGGTAARLTAEDADVVKAVRAARGSAPAAAFREGEVIVAFRAAAEGRDVERALRAGGGLEARRSRGASPRVLVPPAPGLSVDEAVDRFARMPEVEYAEPNGIVRRTEAATLKPDDRYYKYQWNPTQMNAERTWGT